MIRIKDDFIEESDIVLAAFNDCGKEIFLHFKSRNMVIYGPQQKGEIIPRQRVITEAEYSKIKDYFAIDLKARVVA